MNELLTQLAQPFEPKYITWKPGASTKDGGKCMAMAYADLRAYMERLDEVCGADWSCRYVVWTPTQIICELTIVSVTRSSCGEADAQDVKNGLGATVAEAQAFKRACAMFGLGRYLYDLPSVWVEFDAQRKKISDAGQKELDSRYVAWYAKATQKPQETRKESPPHNRMWGFGTSLFGPDWDEGARKWVLRTWSKKHSPDRVRESASDFTEDEKTLIGDWLHEKGNELQRIWNDHKIAKEQAQQAVAA